ncbi:hypothetical protein JOF53_005499 [Crossiella equi]|uniref:YbaB/EbfC DNA-binding family protein n=1 Tax=Crossiella equi TaxID=130796 RepID=A0ABS5AK48_9PSEU|nr:hypothetical protein [Crossiella equi]MBP2476627.1 hypothetical protein [Crossiella equi]
MNDELMAELAQLQQQATALHTLLQDATASMPRQAEGADDSGTIRVTLGPDGLPASFRVEAGWERRLHPEAVGSAVLEAFQAATRQRMAAWSETLATDGWKAQLDRLKAVQGAAGEAPSPVPSQLRTGAAAPRPVDVVAEDMIKVFDTLTSPSTTGGGPAAATGADRSGKLVLSLTQEVLLSCTTEARWAAGQSATRLMNALGEALLAAKAELANQMRTPRPHPTAAADAVLADALALLSSPDRLVD